MSNHARRVIGFRSLLVLAAVGAVALGAMSACGRKAGPEAQPTALALVVDGTLGAPASFGLERLEQALRARGLSPVRQASLEQAGDVRPVLIGTKAGSPAVADLAARGKIALPGDRESLAVKRLREAGRDLLVVAGADERGLMYALLEIARQVEGLPEGAAALDGVEDAAEAPAVPVRSMAVFLHNEDDEKDWFYSEDYWRSYFGMLAENRWNTFNLVFSHQTPYLAPMYPFYVAVEEYPGVKAIGLSGEEREKNLAMLRFISSLARDRGIDFTLSVWQQIAWGVGTHTRTQESMVSGYNEENMTGYTYLALKKLLRECPGITGLQLRLNYESGITYEGQTAFFKDAVFRAAREAGRPIMIEVRDIGLLRETLDAALETELPVRVSHKYWAEHMVFPYHPARFVWTYTYGDWLKYPREADQIYQVWSLGSHRLLLWGDPDFVTRFAPTTRLGESVGFEICAPLSQKGMGNDPGAWRIFRDPGREYYDWEFERYWSTYLLFGRLTYNPGAGDRVWTRELERRFGAAAAPAVARAYRAASQVVSLISGMGLSNHNMYVWPEKDMGGLINYYLNLKPYDRSRIRSFLEYAGDRMAGRSSGRLSPDEVAARLEAIADDTEWALDDAGRAMAGEHKEFWATDMDFRILSGMARYFALKIRAAVRLGLFYESGDADQLRQAVASAESAVDAWKRVAARADEIYSPNLVFGPGSVGHWKDNIPFVEDDLRQLKYQQEIFRLTQNADFAFDFGGEPLTGITEAWSTVYTNHYMNEARFRGVYPSSRFDPAPGYGWIETGDVSAPPVKPVPGAVWQGVSRRPDASFPGNALLGDFISGTRPSVFRIDLPEGHYQGMVVLTDRRAVPTDHGPLSVTVLERFGERPLIDREILRAGQTVVKTFNFNMTGERFTAFRLKFSADIGADYIVNALLFTRIEPHIAHVPVRTAEPGRDLGLSATVTLPAPPNDNRPLTSLGIITSNASTLEMPAAVSRVTLKYGREDARSLETVDLDAAEDAIYTGVLPGAALKPGRYRYHLEAVDSTGRLVRLPREDAARPYFELAVTADRSAPVVTHTPPALIEPGRPLEIKATVADDSAVAKVILYYRPMRQTMEYAAVTMDRDGAAYVATIPGQAISAEYDFMYYFEAFDEHGNAVLHPNPDVTQPYFAVKVQRPAAPGGK